MKAGIAIENWKLPIFQRRLQQSGYAFKTVPNLTQGTMLLTVETLNMEALAEVIKAAVAEATLTGAPKGECQ